MNFDPNKDYYGILGVMPNAEMAVVKAAYKALAGIYHPDRNSSSEAVSKMQEINNAWDILSNNEIKEQYDAAIKNKKPKNEAFDDLDENETVDKYFEEDWMLAISFYPDIVTIEERLTKISKRLGIAYKAYVLGEKKFIERKLIADEMEKEFLRTYFGSNPEVIYIAKALIFEVQDKLLLKDLNNAITKLGTSDLKPIITKFRRLIDQHDKNNIKLNIPNLLDRLKNRNLIVMILVSASSLNIISGFDIERGIFIINILFLILITPLFIAPTVFIAYKGINEVFFITLFLNITFGFLILAGISVANYLVIVILLIVLFQSLFIRLLRTTLPKYIEKYWTKYKDL